MYDDTENEGDQAKPQQALEPVEQDSILFHGEQIVAVRLADGRICVVLRWICESLNLQPGGQVRRIERTAATAHELVRVRVQTGGGRQTMPAITLRGFSPWVLGINPNEVKSDDPVEDQRIRALVIAYQEEAKDVLYEHFVNKHRAGLPAPTDVVPAEPITKPIAPAEDAPLAAWREYYQRMLALIEWQIDIEQWRGGVETRLEHVEAMTDLIPEILERLGPETLTPAHQRRVQVYVQQLSKVSNKHSGTIHNELKTAFDVPRYQDIPEAEWDKVEHWFRVQIERGQKR
jgi:P22_AR N-terminal domain